MRLIFIYGPPASGKYSVAKELSKITNYKLFHNHLTNDLVSAILPYDHPDFWKHTDKFRYELIELAAKEKINIIFTFCYFKPETDKRVKKIRSLIKKHNGKIKFVRLFCEKKELLKRVQHPDRERFSKLREVSILKQLIKTRNYNADVKFLPNLTIDNTNLSAKQVAQKIKKHYQLE